MYVVDITRVNKNKYESDMLVGKLTTDTKTKTMNYIIEYALANLQIAIDPEVLDKELNMDLFFLKPFIKDNYNLDIKDDLVIQSINANKDNCVFVKQFNYGKDPYPYIYQFDKNKINLANSYMAYLINDSLISSLSDEGKLNEYDDKKVDLNNFDRLSYNYNNSSFEITSLYNGGTFIEELLNNSFSYNQLKNSSFDIKM